MRRNCKSRGHGPADQRWATESRKPGRKKHSPQVLKSEIKFRTDPALPGFRSQFFAEIRFPIFGCGSAALGNPWSLSPVVGTARAVASYSISFFSVSCHFPRPSIWNCLRLWNLKAERPPDREKFWADGIRTERINAMPFAIAQSSDILLICSGLPCPRSYLPTPSVLHARTA